MVQRRDVVRDFLDVVQRYARHLVILKEEQVGKRRRVPSICEESTVSGPETGSPVRGDVGRPPGVAEDSAAVAAARMIYADCCFRTRKYDPLNVEQPGARQSPTAACEHRQ
jgi:hypothetical protein